MTTLPNSPAQLKHLEKTLRKESKDEDKQVQHVLKDVAHTEKSASKATKALNKAEKQNEKLGKNEMHTAEAMNKATSKHNRAVNELESSDRDVKLKQQQDVKLHADLEKKKAHADQLVEGQKAHEAARDAKLSEIREAREAADQH
uniref:Uncharacterized protein n=1 Tax=Mycena chlorophos TaxID=658473 RepID=A0ABQ0L5F5_MYCCL|nr:predicted protein [Mycena chlorophos]